MEAQRDFNEWLELLNLHAVEYVVVGAHALAFHGAPRYTGDLDLYIRPSVENARRLMAALSAFVVKNKRATGRKRDLADLEALGED